MKIEFIDGAVLKNMFIAAGSKLEQNKEIVNNLNVFPVPDGDTGTNMGLTIMSSVREIRKLDAPSIKNVSKAASTGSLMGARGNSGVILSQLLRGFASASKEKTVLGVSDLASAIESAAKTAYKAVMKPTEGTILTVAREMGEFATKHASEYDDIVLFLRAVLQQGTDTLARTPEMLEVLKEAGVVDAGGQGLLYLFQGGIEWLEHGSLSEEPIKEPEFVEKAAPTMKSHEEFNIEYGYCTEFMIMTTEGDYEKFRDEIKDMGDSLIVVHGDELIKVHVHTNNPGEILKKAMEIGPLNDIKIDNMRFQHNHLLAEAKEIEATRLPKDESEETLKKYGFVTVALGDGLCNVFKDLGIDEVISGGQTMNPSTEDILKAIEKVHAEHIFVLPNNKNIFLAADQAKHMAKKSVEVIPTHTVPQGFTAMLAFDEAVTAKENYEAMKDSLTRVKTGEITYAVRDSNINSLSIKKDDVLGLLDGAIVAGGKDMETVAKELIEKGADEDTCLISVFYGEDVSEDEAKRFAEELEREYPDYDIELVYGGQSLYYYIFSIE